MKSVRLNKGGKEIPSVTKIQTPRYLAHQVGRTFHGPPWDDDDRDYLMDGRYEGATGTHMQIFKPTQEDLDAYFLKETVNRWKIDDFCIANSFGADTAYADKRTIHFVIDIKKNIDQMQFWANKYTTARPFVIGAIAAAWTKESPWIRIVDISTYRPITENEYSRMIKPDDVLVQNYLHEIQESYKAGQFKNLG